MPGRRVLVSLLVMVAVAAGGSSEHARAAPTCGLPAASPLWIDYADGLTTDVRDVLARPGVVVSSSGTALPAYFRAHGAATTYFALHLPALVGQPSAPADPASIAGAAAKLRSQAVTSTGCATPQVALNELFGSNLPAPWSATNTVYRANVLALMQQLAAGGAFPVLLVHGDYTLTGATADWWRQVAQSGEIVYEDYYDASHISALGSLMGNRCMRIVIRQVVSDFGGIGIQPDRLGVMLGFHAGLTPGIDQLRAQVELQTRQQQLIAVQNEYAKQKLNLARAIGLPVGQEFVLTDNVPYAPLESVKLEEAVARAYSSRFDYQEAMARVRAAERARKAATAERLPSLAFNADYGDIGIAPGISHGTLTVAGTLEIPVFQGGRVRGDVLQADAILKQRESELEDLRARIDYQVRTALMDLTAAADQISVARSSLELANATVTQAQDRFAAGVVDNLEVVQAQESVANANEAYISSLYAHNIAKVLLARAMGVAQVAVSQFLGSR